MEAHTSFPFKSYTTLRNPEEIAEGVTKAVGSEYAKQILEGKRNVVATCGSGMTAAVLWIGLSRLWEAEGKPLPALGIYDEVILFPDLSLGRVIDFTTVLDRIRCEDGE